MQLYNLARQFNDVLAMVDDNDDPQAILDSLEGIKGEMLDKVENTVILMKSIEADEATIKKEEERLYNRRLALQNRRESIKKYLEETLIQSNISKVKTALFSVSIQANKKTVVVDESNEQLKEYRDVWVQHPDTIDKIKLYELLKSGKEISGAELKESKSLRIR
jgi:hypothetical protein